MTAYQTPIDWSNFTIQSDQEFTIRQPITPSSFVFHSGGANTEVGRFEVIDGQMRFTGNVDETGKVMIEWFLKTFNDRIEADKKACRNAALLEAAQMCHHLAISGAECWMEPRTDCEEAIREMLK